MRWRHVVISTLNSWLPGDPRGFRSRDHKVHSSGDYKNPPPTGEHEGLYNYSKEISGSPVVIPRHLREAAGRAIRRKLKKRNLRVLAVSVAGMHAHPAGGIAGQSLAHSPHHRPVQGGRFARSAGPPSRSRLGRRRRIQAGG
jgi:hypothetical protein